MLADYSPIPAMISVGYFVEGNHPMAKIIASSDDMPHMADVIIIGGGPAGTAALWAIERAASGTKSVLLEQRDILGAGSSLASLESYRSCWSTPCIARQMVLSIKIFHNANDYLGDGAAQAIAVNQHGYLFCGFNERQADTLKRDVNQLHSLGLTHVEFLDSDEVAYRFPWLDPTVVAAKYDPQAGSLDSNGLIHQYVRSAPSATVVLNVADIQIRIERMQVRGVTTNRGDIAAPNVVIAAGAGTRSLGQTAGIDIPVILRPRQSFTTAWRHDPFPADAPLIIGAAPFPHVRPEARSGAIFGWEYQWHTKHVKQAANNTGPDALRDPIYPVDQLKDLRFPSVTLLLLARQFGHKDGNGFTDSRYLRGIKHNIGYYVYRDATAAYISHPDGTQTPYPSERAIIDAYPGIEGLFVSSAHAGHGIMTSPAAGEILASKVLRGGLSDPLFAQFGFDVPWVEHDKNSL
jgi:glycine/D-amino acid oxidase-like deaminating enzyme